MDGGLRLLPPRPDLCQTCATDHDPAEPHNQQSLFYQMRFHAEHGRWPTWTDALAHCDDATQDAWRQALRENGLAMDDALDAWRSHPRT